MTIGDIVNKENYTAYAIWCNANNAHIEMQDGKYVVVENPTVEVAEETASELDKISAQVMYTALMTDSLIDDSAESEEE